MTEMIHLEAAERVVGAMLKIAAEDTARIVALEAEISELQRQVMDNANAWCAPPDWKALKNKVQDLLELCDELERDGREHRFSDDQVTISISEIRERLKP